MLHDRFRVEPRFGAEFCYSVDRPLQVFFKSMMKWKEPALEGDADYLQRKAQALITAVDEGLGLNVVLPKVLIGRISPASGQEKAANRAASPTKKQKLSTGTGKVIAGTGQSTKKGSAPHTNAKPVGAWTAPKGADYLTFFPNRAPSALPWPRFRDRRLDSERNPHSKAVPMCVRFQATGKCSMGCSLAHVLREEMSKDEQNVVAKLFKDAYTNAPATTDLEST